jgi:hypothetical protein
MAFNPALNAALNVLWIVSLGIWVFAGSIKFWNRRKKEPIRSRRPFLVLVMVNSLFLYAVLKIVAHAFIDYALRGYNCGVAMIFEKFLEAMSMIFVLLRVGVITLDFLVSKKSGMFREKRETTSGVSAMNQLNASQDVPFVFKLRKWYNIRYLRRRFYILLILSVFILIAAPIASIAVLFGLERNDPQCIDNFIKAGFVEAGVIFIIILLLVRTSFALSSASENFGISVEITRISFYLMIGDIFLILNLVLSVAPENWLSDSFGVQCYLLIELIFPLVFISYESLWKQVAVTDHWTQILMKVVPGLRESKNDDLTEFFELLMDPKGYLSFSTFAMMDLASEMLLFWKDIERFRAKQLTAQEIYDTYISLTSPLHVNLSLEVTDNIDLLFSQVSDSILSRKHDRSKTPLLARDFAEDYLTPIRADEEVASSGILQAFEEAQKEVFLHMYEHQYGRFKLTKEYKLWLEHIRPEAKKQTIAGRTWFQQSISK